MARFDGRTIEMPTVPPRSAKSAFTKSGQAARQAAVGPKSRHQPPPRTSTADFGRGAWPRRITGAILFPWKRSRVSRRSPSGSNATLPASRAAAGTLSSASFPLGHASNADASWNSHRKRASVSDDMRTARWGAKGSGVMITVRRGANAVWPPPTRTRPSSIRFDGQRTADNEGERLQ
jgi:hypothetical protein